MVAPSPLPSVALNLLTLVPGGMGGTETYARELISRLAVSDEIDVTTVVPRGARGFTGGSVRETVVETVGGGASTRERLTSVLQATMHRRSILGVLGRSDVVHLPFTAEIPQLPTSFRVVQTVHDVQHLDLPHLFGRAELTYRRWSYERAARNADLVLTISEFSRERIVDMLGVSADRVVVAPLGVNTTDFTPNLGEREDFVLYPARGWAHKNHAALVAAMAIVRETSPETRLVLTGGALDSLGNLPAWVDVRGLVPLEELRNLYRTASVMAFPSLYEGFGLPPLEAMASGCPVAASNAGSLPEICGDAAALFDASRPEDIARAILAARSDSTELQRRGILRAEQFTWDRCAAVHVEAYLAVAGR